jgi:hypothetical protein
MTRAGVLLALLVTALSATVPGAAARSPTRLWYQVKIVYVGTATDTSILRDGTKQVMTYHSAFIGQSDGAVLVRVKPGGRFFVLGGRMGGKLSTFEQHLTRDNFPNSHAPCTDGFTAKLTGGSLVIDGAFAAEPGLRRDQTQIGVAAVAPAARLHWNWPAVAPCAGIPASHSGELLNPKEVNAGEKPLYKLRELDYNQAFGGSVTLMERVAREDQRQNTIVRLSSNFGKGSFTLLATPKVRIGPKRFSDGSIIHLKIDELWTFEFTRCPGTAPC